MVVIVVCATLYFTSSENRSIIKSNESYSDYVDITVQIETQTQADSVTEVDVTVPESTVDYEEGVYETNEDGSLKEDFNTGIIETEAVTVETVAGINYAGLEPESISELIDYWSTEAGYSKDEVIVNDVIENGEEYTVSFTTPTGDEWKILVRSNMELIRVIRP